MKSLFKYIAIGLAGIMTMSSCSDFLDEEAQGIVTEEDFNTAENVEQLCNAAYSSLGNTTWHRPLVSLWSLGCVRSGDTYKEEAQATVDWLTSGKYITATQSITNGQTTSGFSFISTSLA